MTSRNGTDYLGQDSKQYMTSRARDVARDVTDVQRIGAGALSMPNFEFFKSDHY